jgi:hypothetical protein
MRVGRCVGLWLVVLLGGPARVWALEQRKETTSAPPAEPAPVEKKPEPPAPSLWYLLEDKGYFLPPIADVAAPTNYMRFYVASPVNYSTNIGKKHHVFWDVGFGEEFFFIGRNNRTADGTPPALDVRWPTGWSVFIDGDMHMLLDFNGYSKPVIDAEFRVGGGLMGRGIPFKTPPGTPWSHLAWRLKFFHESTHIGDEYLDDIRRRQQAPQGGDPPTAGFIHANVSYLALEFLLAIDGEFDARSVDQRIHNKWYWRIYGGYRRLLTGPYDTGVPFPGLDPGAVITNAGQRNEGQFGAELRYRWSAFGAQGTRRPDYLVLASDTYLRKQYDFEGHLAAPRWPSVNIMAGIEWGDWADDQMTFRLLLSYYNGINPHGQFRNELLDYWGLTAQIDY